MTFCYVELLLYFANHIKEHLNYEEQKNSLEYIGEL